jgi:hypothetical protein
MRYCGYASCELRKERKFELSLMSSMYNKTHSFFGFLTGSRHVAFESSLKAYGTMPLGDTKFVPSHVAQFGVLSCQNIWA